MGKLKNIFIAGHRGMVGSAIYRKLNRCDDVKLIVRTRNELDLLNQVQVDTFLRNKTSMKYI